MEMLKNEKEKMKFVAKLNVSLANAIRRTINHIPILAIQECDIYKNDSVLYDEIIAHRLGLLSLKNQKLGKGKVIELKLKAKGKGERTEVLAGKLGDDVVYEDTPIVELEDGQELEIVARAGMGIAKEHAKYSPGLMFYRYFPNIKISKEGENKIELSKLYPDVFEFKDKLKVKDASNCHLDVDDFNNFPGVDISFGDDVIIEIESWGQISPKNILIESCKAFQEDLDDLGKALK